MYVILWRYRARRGSEREFEKAYAPNGVWAEFFRKRDGFVGTELFQGANGTYVTIDRWDSKDSFETFARKHRDEYRQIDMRCDALTEEEIRLGDYTSIERSDGCG